MSKEIAIIDYKMGNTASVVKAFQKLGAIAKLTNDPEEIRRADALVLPGVGAFRDGIQNLRDLGLVELLKECVLDQKVPFLAICIGMQLLGDRSYEFGEHEGLGWIPGEVRQLEGGDLRLPHIGWNDIAARENALLFKDIPDENFYFVHSFHLKPKDPDVIAATCDYGETFVASIQKGNIYATQFHPEKSQDSGLKLLQNFLDIVHA